MMREHDSGSENKDRHIGPFEAHIEPGEFNTFVDAETVTAAFNEIGASVAVMYDMGFRMHESRNGFDLSAVPSALHSMVERMAFEETAYSRGLGAIAPRRDGRSWFQAAYEMIHEAAQAEGDPLTES